MWTRIGLTLLLILGGWAFYSPPVHASCEVQTSTPTYTDGQFIGADLCDVNGNKKVTAVGAGTATEAAPTYSEGSAGSFSFDLAGNARVTLGTLFSGEDQTNDLLMTSGGQGRITTLGAVTSATTSAVTTGYVGPKTFMAQIINATSETKAATVVIKGNWTSSTTGGIDLCTITLPSTVTVLQLQDVCPVVTASFPFYFYTASVYTSASSAPLTVYQLH